MKGGWKMSQKSAEIDYEIIGTEMQLVEIELDPQESVIAEGGSMRNLSARKTLFFVLPKEYQ